MTFMPLRFHMPWLQLLLLAFLCSLCTRSHAQMGFTVWGHSYSVQAPPTPTGRAVCGSAWCGSAPPAPHFCPACIARMQQEAANRQAAHDANERAKAERRSEHQAAEEQRRLERNVNNLSNQANHAIGNGDWNTALTLLRRAYALQPTGEMLGLIRDATLHQMQQNGTEALASNAMDMRVAIENEDGHYSGVQDSAALRQLNAAVSTMLATSTQPANTGNDFFLTRSRFAAPLPKLFPTPLPVASVNSALEMLSSISTSSEQATLDANIEIAKAVAGCGFDGAPCAEAEHLTYPHPVQTPAAAALEAKIPAAMRNDPRVQQRLREYDHFQQHLAEKQMQIAAVTHSIQAGGADTIALKAYRADLQHQAAQDTASIAQTVTYLHFSVPTLQAPALPAEKPSVQPSRHPES